MLKGQRVLIHDTLLAELAPGQEYPVYWRDDEVPYIKTELELDGTVYETQWTLHYLAWMHVHFTVR